MDQPGVPEARPSLFRDRNVRLLWISDSVSQAGSAFTDLGLPLTAVILLHATARQMGWLSAAEAIPRVALVLVGGIVADRVRRQPLLVQADVVAALLIGSTPIAAAFDVLTFAQLVIVAVLAGALAGIVGPAISAFTPVVIPPEDLPRANRLFHGTAGAISIATPPIAGSVITSLPGACPSCRSGARRISDASWTTASIPRQQLLLTKNLSGLLRGQGG